MTKDMTLIEDMVLLKVSVRAWLGTVKNDKAARDAEESSGADVGTVDATVKSLAEDYAGPIRHARSIIRAYWYGRTIPWLDGGYRIVAATEYQSLMDGLADLIQKHWEGPVNKLLSEYDQAREAARSALGELFSPEKFPSKDDMAEMYDVDIFRTSVQNPQDIRISGMSEEEIQKISDDLKSKYETQINNAVQMVMDRIRIALRDVAQRMEKEPKGTKYKGLWDNLNGLVDTLPGLNITENAEIDRAIQRIKKEISSVSVDDLRDNAKVRKAVKKAALSITGEMDGKKGKDPTKAIKKSGVNVSTGSSSVSEDMGKMFK